MAGTLANRTVDEIKKAGGKPFLIDTNTLYKGSRANAVDHLETAMKNGFSYATVGAPIVIGDGLIGRRHRHLAGHEVIPGIAHLDLNDIADDPEGIDVFGEQQLDCFRHWVAVLSGVKVEEPDPPIVEGPNVDVIRYRPDGQSGGGDDRRANDGDGM